MPANHANRVPFPVRGVPGGWRDPWDDDDTAMVRARAEDAERRFARDAERIGRQWREELADDRRR